MAKYTAFPLLQQLKGALTSNPPYCSGILEVPQDAFKLYYGKGEARFIDLLEASQSTSNNRSELDTLANACEAARFGRGDETVLDETYRKAGKMDSDSFMTGLDIHKTGLLDSAIRLGLLADETRTVHAELYKLNVYGQGAFFKPHKDTPRSESMFGSLVVIFPTPHEGGALILRHDNEEFTFDAATLLSERNNSVAYVTFFSDVEHEVLPVLSGHRIALTYNLYYGAQGNTTSFGSPNVLQPLHANTSAVKGTLASLLGDRTFLPQGGTLGFGLRHTYPFPKVWTRGMQNPLESLKTWLKGSDAALFAACDELGVRPRLRLVCKQFEYDDEANEVLLDRMLELGDYVENADMELQDRGGLRIFSYTFTGDAGRPWSHGDPKYDNSTSENVEGWAGYEDALAVHWLTEASSEDGPRSAYVAYGNEASLEWLYTGVCLIAKIGPYGRRSGGT